MTDNENNKKNINSGIGIKIKAQRKRKNLSQAQLAELVGMAEKQLSRIEGGKNYPSLDNFLKIINALDMKMSEFDDCSTPYTAAREAINHIISNSTEKELNLYLDVLISLQKTFSKHF